MPTAAMCCSSISVATGERTNRDERWQRRGARPHRSIGYRDTATGDAAKSHLHSRLLDGRRCSLVAAATRRHRGIIADSPYARLERHPEPLVTWQPPTEAALAQAFAATASGLSSSWSHYLLRQRSVISAALSSPVAGAPRATDSPFWHSTAGRRHETVLAAIRRPPLLLIHSLRDPYIQVDHAYRIARAAFAGHVPIELHFADSDVHCGAYGHDPEQYVSLVPALSRRHKCGPVFTTRTASNLILQRATLHAT